MEQTLHATRMDETEAWECDQKNLRMRFANWETGDDVEVYDISCLVQRYGSVAQELGVHSIIPE
jgi:hypothetical protein